MVLEALTKAPFAMANRPEVKPSLSSDCPIGLWTWFRLRILMPAYPHLGGWLHTLPEVWLSHGPSSEVPR